MVSPRPDDVVLGGQSTAPLDAAVLGGIQGIWQMLNTNEISIKKLALQQSLNYGDKGIKLLFERLSGNDGYK